MRGKKGGEADTPDYFDELLARIRDTRSSEFDCPRSQ